MNFPPRIILPSDCTSIALISSSKPVPILKLVSTVPLAFNLTILFVSTPLNEVKFPVSKIFPSGKTLIFEIRAVAPKPVKKEVSKVPFGKIRAIRFTVLLLYFVKLPTIIIFPSACGKTL